MLKHLDLFSGIGGFALAARWVGGIETRQFVELDPYCQKVLTKNFPGIPIHGDIRTYTAQPGEFDLITGGFPCQDNSTANQKGKGLQGNRSGLWFEMQRVINGAKSRFVVVENVPPSKNRRWDETVRKNLEELGYQTTLLRLSAKTIGANHTRKRVFVIAYTNPFMRDPFESSYQLSRACTHQEKSTWWQDGGELRRGVSGRVYLLPRSWACRMDDGLPSRLDVDRLKALGNAVTPQQAIIPLRRILELNEP